MAAYFIAQYVVTDPKLYREYQVAAGPTIQASGGEVVAFDVAAETIEGTPPGPQTVIVKFESTEAAKAWYGSAGVSGRGRQTPGGDARVRRDLPVHESEGLIRSADRSPRAGDVAYRRQRLYVSATRDERKDFRPCVNSAG